MFTVKVRAQLDYILWKLAGVKLKSRSRSICFAYTQFDEDTEFYITVSLRI
jgi:hypothetical protein